MTSFRKQRTRLGLSLRQLSQQWGISPAQLSLIERGKKPIPLWTKDAFAGLRKRLSGEGRGELDALRSAISCPECGVPMRTLNGYLTHWFHKRLKIRMTCTGDPPGTHKPIGVGILVGKARIQRLDRTTNPHTQKEVPLALRRSETFYERRYDWVWCDSSSGRPDGCGWVCKPSGKYAFHARSQKKGTVYQIFKCENPECKYYLKRLKARGGKASDIVPSVARKTTLPRGAQQCPYCGGNTNRKALADVPAGMIQVVCTRCGKIAYFHMQARKFVRHPRLRSSPSRSTPATALAPPPSVAGSAVSSSTSSTA